MSKMIDYEIIEHYGTISTDQNGYTKEVTLMSWNGAESKIDIRNWKPEMKAPLKGIALTYEEAQMLADIIKNIE